MSGLTKEAFSVRRILDLRITRWSIKLAYIIGVGLVWFLLRALLRGINDVPISGQTLNWIVLLAGILLAARIFRGKGEPVAPARPWWQMTAWPTLGLVLGGVQSIGVLSSVFFIVWHVATYSWELGLDWMTAGQYAVDLVFNVIVFYLYLNSAVRQIRAGVTRPVPPVAPTFTPWSKLD
jgi:hypothetical protein